MLVWALTSLVVQVGSGSDSAAQCGHTIHLGAETDDDQLEWLELLGRAAIGT